MGAGGGAGLPLPQEMVATVRRVEEPVWMAETRIGTVVKEVTCARTALLQPNPSVSKQLILKARLAV